MTYNVEMKAMDLLETLKIVNQFVDSHAHGNDPLGQDRR